MAEVLLFHHAQGRTDGFLSFADELRAAGHVVHAPDLYDGKTFADLNEGVDYAKQVGFDVIIPRGAAAAEDLAAELVYASNAELCLYPGDGHLFADSSLADFNEEAAALLKKRTVALLEAAG